MANFFKNLNFNFQHLLALIIVITCFVYFSYISGKGFSQVQNNNIVDVKTVMTTVLTMVVMHYYRQQGSDKKKDDDLKKE